MATRRSISPKEADTPEMLTITKRKSSFPTAVRKREITGIVKNRSSLLSPFKVSFFLYHPAKPHYHELLLFWGAAQRKSIKVPFPRNYH